MADTVTIPDTLDEILVRVGDRFVSPPAAQLHIFGVLLGAHLGEVGFVPDEDLATLPAPIRDTLHELVDERMWWHVSGGYRIDRDYALNTMRDSLNLLNDPRTCVATGSQHVRGANGTCARCGAERV